MMPSELPDRPWQLLGSDLFELNKCHYLLVVDYYSRYIEIAKLTTTTSADVITHLKSIFARHGIPDELRTDNGPQYASAEFASFTADWGVTHVTSSPNYPQSNGEAERAVKTMKGMLHKADDPYLALLAYRTTPLANGYSPAELLMGRKLQSTIPIVSTKLQPNLLSPTVIREKEQETRKDSS
jgi:transposase InsO family protein